MQPQSSPRHHHPTTTVINLPAERRAAGRFTVLVCVIVTVISLGVGWSQRNVADQWRRQVTEREQQLIDAEAEQTLLADALNQSEESVADLTKRLDSLAAQYAQLQDPP